MPTADERRYQMQTAALIRSSREPDGAKMTEKARTAFRQSFYDRTDPALPHHERQRQADAAYRVHMRSISTRRRSGRIAAAEARDSGTRGALTAEDVLKLIRAELPGMLREALADVLAPAPGMIELALKDSGLPQAAQDITLTLSRMAGTGMPSPSLSELAEMVGVDRRTVMRNLQVLETAGWVRRLRADLDRARTEHVTTAYVVTIPATRGK